MFQLSLKSHAASDCAPRIPKKYSEKNSVASVSSVKKAKIGELKFTFSNSETIADKLKKAPVKQLNLAPKVAKSKSNNIKHSYLHLKEVEEAVCDNDSCYSNSDDEEDYLYKKKVPQTKKPA